MKHILSICLFIAPFILHAQDEINVMTFNIRLDLKSDSLNRWDNRKDKVASQILFHRADIIGVQEALFNQMQDLQMRLPNFQYTGGGREDGYHKGEFSAIFFDKRKFKMLKSQTFWLSDQPSAVGKKGWDAALPRIVTWAKFRDITTRKIFYVFNTHFDHVGVVARRESAKLLLKKVKEIAENAPCIITGDFNAPPADEPIRILTDKNDPDRLIDSKNVSISPHYGPEGTFNGFKSKETSDLPIDYIFIKNGVLVSRHATLSQSWQGRFSSDHFPVMATVIIK